MKLSVLRGLSLFALAALAGCAASPPARYYTLVAPVPQAARPAAGYMIEVLPVAVPAQADQPQIMLRTGAGEVSPLFSDRWSSPLADEVRAALSDALTRDLGALDVQVVHPVQADAAVWRIQVDVRRFEMVSGGPAVLDATWRVRPVGAAGQPLLCRSVVTMPVNDGGVAGLVAGQQQAVAQLAAAIAAAIRSGGQAPAASGLAPMSGCTNIRVNP